MKFFTRFLIIAFIAGGLIFALGYFSWYRPKFIPSKKSFSFHPLKKPTNNAAMHKLKMKAEDLRAYIRDNHFNESICFLIDMRISSGKKRFFVYNLKKDSVEMAGLVTHGSGSGYDESDLYFSNEPGSNCTSLGKYKIGKPYNGQFGLAYKLYGLDASNSKAFERFVVLHAHACVPAEEVYPVPICKSFGCPTVAPSFLQMLKNYIDNSEKPILLNIYQ